MDAPEASLIHVGVFKDQTWLWLVEALIQDLWRCLSADWIWCSTSYGCSIQLGSGEFGGKVDALSSFLGPILSSHVAMRVCSWSATVFRWVIVSSGIHMDASTKCFLEDHCLTIRWLMLYTLPVRGFNAVAAQCISNIDQITLTLHWRQSLPSGQVAVDWHYGHCQNNGLKLY